MTNKIMRPYMPMNFKPRSWEEIFYSLLRNAYNVGLLSDDRNFLDYVQHKKQIENDLILTLSTIATQLEEGYQDLNSIYLARDLSKATGEDLDVLGTPFYPRINEAAAVTDLKFTCNDPVEKDTVIPLGFLVKHETEDTILFTTIEEGIILTGESEITLQAQCTQTGEAGNVPPHTLTEIIKPIDGVDTVTNEYMSSGGVNRESDDNYRQRLFEWRWVMEKGTYSAVVNAIKNVPSVTGFHIQPYWMGYGTLLIIIDPPTQAVFDLVNAELDTVKATDEEWTIQGVELVPIDASFVVNVSLDEAVAMSAPEMANIEFAVGNYIKTYLDGGLDARGELRDPIPIGRDVVPFEIGRFVSEQIPSIRNFETQYPKEPVVIEAYQRATSGSISVKVI